MNEFFSSTLFLQLTGWLTLLSLATLMLSIIFIPWFIGRMEADFFIDLHNRNSKQPGPIWLLILRNLLGIVLLIAGILMLFLPGQGLITIFIGLLLLSFPGKALLLIKLTQARSIRRSLNWLRKNRNKQNFIWPD